MNTKRLCCSAAVLTLTASVALAVPRHNQERATTRARTPAITTRTTATTGGTTRFRDRTVVFVGGGFGFGFPYSYYPYSYYPYSYYPYSYYPYSYYSGYSGYSGYPYYGYSPYGYNYGYYYNHSPYRDSYANSSIVVRVQTQLARTGYYHGAIDGVMGPRTRAAIRAYERTHGLPVDGMITGRLTATMGGRY